MRDPGEVLDLIRQRDVHHYSIIRHGATLFTFFRCVGADFETGMKLTSRHSTNLEWWKLTDLWRNPCRIASQGIDGKRFPK